MPSPNASIDSEPGSESELLGAEVERLGFALEEANGIIDELRAEAWTLKEKARAAEAIAQAERDAAEAARVAAEAAMAEAEASVVEADEAAGAGNAEADTAWAEADASRRQADAASEEAAAARGEADAARGEAADADARAEAVQAEAERFRTLARELEAKAEASAAEAEALKVKVAALERRIAELEASREAKAATLSSWGGLRLDPAAYPEILRKGFDGASKARMGTWAIKDGVAAQTDAAQYFSRLTFPLLQSSKPTLYSFDVKAGPKGWVGAGIHFFAEGVKKPKGYGEGRSLLVWLTRDAKMRGDYETYLQIYRSDDDVNMERVLDAEIEEGVASWNRLDILYEPGAEFVVIAVNGSVRAAYRTFFGIGTGVTVSLRTLGAGVSFRNFEIRR